MESTINFDYNKSLSRTFPTENNVTEECFLPLLLFSFASE